MGGRRVEEIRAKNKRQVSIGIQTTERRLLLQAEQVNQPVINLPFALSSAVGRRLREIVISHQCARSP